MTSEPISIEVDDESIIKALLALGDAAVPPVNRASYETAKAVIREAAGRLQRQLGPNATGQTLGGLEVVEHESGVGYLVVSKNPRMPMLPIWIELGTKKGKPGSHSQEARPYFYASVQLERASHRRRVAEALQEAIDSLGLGE